MSRLTIRLLVTLCAIGLTLGGSPPNAAAGTIAPMLSLSKVGAATTFADSILAGTATYTLDLRVNTGGVPVSGLQYYLSTSPANALTFAATPLLALSAPFTPADLSSGPTSGATVNQTGAVTIWFKGGAGDYPAIGGNAIGRYSFNTSALSPGTYTITPFGQELTNMSGTITFFGIPQSFSLTIVPVPEPHSLVLLLLGGTALSARRSRASSRGRAAL